MELASLGRTDVHYCIVRECEHLKNTMNNPKHHYMGKYYCELSIDAKRGLCPRWKEYLERVRELEKLGVEYY